MYYGFVLFCYILVLFCSMHIMHIIHCLSYYMLYHTHSHIKTSQQHKMALTNFTKHPYRHIIVLHFYLQVGLFPCKWSPFTHISTLTNIFKSNGPSWLHGHKCPTFSSCPFPLSCNCQINLTLKATAQNFGKYTISFLSENEMRRMILSVH